jgi:hypothetical protein
LLHNYIYKNFTASHSLFFILIISLFVPASVKAQWVNNPALNNKFVVDASDPINISTAADNKGGAFIFWEDNKHGFSNDIYFLHVDANGKPSFRADGKKISEAAGIKVKPETAGNLPGTAVVVWNDFSRSKQGNLFVQKVINNGNLMWGNNGVQISRNLFDTGEYSIESDSRGNTFVSYIGKEEEFGNQFSIFLQKLNYYGTPLYGDEGKRINVSNWRKSMSSVLPDDNGGAFLFWIESHGNKSSIFSQHIDSVGNVLWGKKPLMVSNPEHNVVTYSVQKTDFNSLYIAWQVHQTQRVVYHQLIDFKGKNLWTSGGKPVTSRQGNQTNPQVLTADSVLIVSWTNDQSDKNIYIQRFDKTGRALWAKDGVAVIEIEGDQFGQKLLPDGTGGAIVSWIDKRFESIKANIYAQRVTYKGELDWREDAIEVASNHNTDKSYVSIVSDNRGGIIAVFKEKREGNNLIYGQKLFNTGTYVSQIVGLTVQSVQDSVKISWYSANEPGNTTFDIERSSQSESGGTRWGVIGSIFSEVKSSAKYYEYYDIPDESGSIYYRIVQRDNEGNIQPSDVVRLIHLDSGYDFIVTQNSPNPFNNETTINFNLPFNSMVKVEFYNSQIEKVHEINERFPVGQNKIVFKADGFHPGIYFYRFTAGDFVDVKKMIIVN